MTVCLGRATIASSLLEEAWVSLEVASIVSSRLAVPLAQVGVSSCHGGCAGTVLVLSYMYCPIAAGF